MHTKLAAGVAGLLLLATASWARAEPILVAEVKSSGFPAEDLGGRLSGTFDGTFVGTVGSNAATFTAPFVVTGGSFASAFGGVGATASLVSNLSNFQSTVTGMTGVDSQPAFGGDLFAEVETYAASPDLYGVTSTQHVMFDFDEIRIDGLGGQYASAGPGSVLMAHMGKIYNFGGQLYLTFWFDRTTFNVPDGTLTVVESADFLTAVVSHQVIDPIPEPSTWAALALTTLGAGGWLLRRRRRR